MSGVADGLREVQVAEVGVVTAGGGASAGLEMTNEVLTFSHSPTLSPSLRTVCKLTNRNKYK